MSTNPEVERKKQMFLTVIKWCSKHAGARIKFDPSCNCPQADVDTKIITMPTMIAINRADSMLGIIIHEAMHIKHTPKWLNDLVRDPIDKIIFNGLEDCRIETYACNQLRALKHFLKAAVYESRALIKDPSIIKLGFRVITNIACRVSETKLFDDRETRCSENDNKELLDNLRDIYRRIFTVTMKKSFIDNVEDLYKKIDEFRRIYNLPKADPSKKEQKKVPGMGEYEGNIRQEAAGEMSKKRGLGRGLDIEDQLDLSDMNTYMIDLNEQAKVRIKETLKKSLETIIDEGNTLNTDNLVELLIGNIDEVFIDTKIEKKVRTKVYFLVDASGSMSSNINDEATAIEGLDANVTCMKLAISAFTALEEIVLEMKEIYGMDMDYETYLFADNCERVASIKQPTYVGGGTQIIKAFKKVLKSIHNDDPANKRILIILTDGEIGYNVPREMVDLINHEAQDIRVVVTGIGDSSIYAPELIKRSIVSPLNAEAVLIEGLEECL